MLSNAYFLAKFRFDTAENEPAKNLQNFRKMHFSKMHFRKMHSSKMHRGGPLPAARRCCGAGARSRRRKARAARRRAREARKKGSRMPESLQECTARAFLDPYVCPMFHHDLVSFSRFPDSLSNCKQISQKDFIRIIFEYSWMYLLNISVVFISYSI